MKNKIKVIGMDLALNHLGFVELTDGELSNFWYITTIASSASISKRHGYRLILSKSHDRQIVSVDRLSKIVSYVKKNILNSKNLPDFVGIEDYALKADQGAHYLGEIGGLIRYLCWKKNIPFRLHDPISVKMFVTHDGTAQKDAIEREVLRRWKVKFSLYNQPTPKATIKKPNPKQKRTTSEDLADAFSIAKLVWTEIQLRNGVLSLSDLHEKEIRVFNRVTKTYPISLLGRDWIQGNQINGKKNKL